MTVAVESSIVGRATSRIKQQCLVSWVEHWRVSRVRIQSCKEAKKQTDMRTASECARFSMCGEGGRVFKKKKQTGLTRIVRAVFPECFPFPEIERHAALGVDYHGE
jgi:hypothetical protein